MKFSRKLFRTKFINEADFRNGVLTTLRPYFEALLGTKELTKEETIRYGDMLDDEWDK